MAKKERVLAVDPGTKTGWATEESSGMWDLTPLKASSAKGREAEPEFFRCGKLWEALDAHAGQVDAIVCEGAIGFARGKAAIRVSNELRGVVKAWCKVRGARYVEIQPQDLQRFVGGRAKVPKEEMVKIAQGRYGWGGTDDNEADALHLRQWAREQLPAL